MILDDIRYPSDSDLSTSSNWSVLDDSDNGCRNARRIAAKRTSKTRQKPPKSKKKIDIVEEMFLMDDILSPSSSNESLEKEDEIIVISDDSCDDFEEIQAEQVETANSRSTTNIKQVEKSKWTRSRNRNLNICQFMGLLLLMTSFSYVTSLVGSQFLLEPAAVIVPEGIAEQFEASTMNDGKQLNKSSTIQNIPFLVEEDLDFPVPSDPSIMIVPTEKKSGNSTKLEDYEVKPHFHNDGQVTYGPATYRDYLNTKKYNLNELNNTTKPSETKSDRVFGPMTYQEYLIKKKRTFDKAKKLPKPSPSFNKTPIFGPMTYEDHLKDCKSNSDDLKDLPMVSQSFNKTISKLMTNAESKNNLFQCCNFKIASPPRKQIDKKELSKSKIDNQKPIDKLNEDTNLFIKKLISKKNKHQKKSNKTIGTAEVVSNLKSIPEVVKPVDKPTSWNFNKSIIDDIINNYSSSPQKKTNAIAKGSKAADPLPKSDNLEQCLHRPYNRFKICKHRHRNYQNVMDKISKRGIFIRFLCCAVFDIVAILIIRKLGIAIVGKVRSLIRKPSSQIIRKNASTAKNLTPEESRANLFDQLPFQGLKRKHSRRSGPRPIPIELEKEADACLLTVNNKALVESKTKITTENPSDYYMLMLNLKMQSLNNNIKISKDTDSNLKQKRYSKEFKESLMGQLYDIYKSLVTDDKHRKDLVFCIMKIYECKFEYMPTSADQHTLTFERLQRFKELLVDYYRYLDNPEMNTRYICTTTDTQKHDLIHILDLMLEDRNITMPQESAVENRRDANAFDMSFNSSTNSKTSMVPIESPDAKVYMRDKFGVLRQFWKLKQAYLTKRIQICNILKDKLSQTNVSPEEGATLLDGIISRAVNKSETELQSNVSNGGPTVSQNCRDALKVSAAVIAEVVNNVNRAFESTKRKRDQDKPGNCHRVCRVNNELYRELFEKKAQAIQEKDLTKYKAMSLLTTRASEVSTKIDLSRPHQVRDPRMQYKQMYPNA